MLELSEIPLFAGLTADERAAVERLANVVDYPTGATLCRKGEEGRQLFVIGAGGVKVMFGESEGYFLGPGEALGELSLLSSKPVSVSVFAAKPTRAYTLPKEAFLNLMDTCPVFHRAVSDLVVNRLRQSPQERSGAGPACCIIAVPDGHDEGWFFARALYQAIRGYAAEALYCEWRRPNGDESAPATRFAGGTANPFLSEALHPFDLRTRAGEYPGFGIHRDKVPLSELLVRWRAEGVAGQHLIVVAPWSAVAGLELSLCDRDAVVSLVLPDAPLPEVKSSGYTFGRADFLFCEIKRANHGSQLSKERWHYDIEIPDLGALDRGELTVAQKARLHWLARWITRSGIGIALGSGAARGFAHLGVLKVLEQNNIPIDYFSGTSIGGIVGLTYALVGSADEAAHCIRETLGRRKYVLDLASTFKTSIYGGNKIRNTAERVFGDKKIGDLHWPVSTVSADLISGHRVVIDSGSLKLAALSTSAIPGFFPPVPFEDKILFDGASVSRVPVDLLQQHRCGAKIAVNVAPIPGNKRSTAESVRKRINAQFGFRNVWLRSWEVQAYWHGAKEASHADILLEPDTNEFSMLDFDHFDELYEIGVREAERKLEGLKNITSFALSNEAGG